MKKIKLATVFSGIGAIEFALKRLNLPYEIVFACDNGEVEIDYDSEKEFSKIKSLNNIDDKHDYVDKLYKSKTRRTNFVKKTYLANYECNEKRFFEDIKLLDGTDFKDQVDLFVGGSPCQSFSSVGHKGGLEDARGTLFYEFARLVKEIQPKVFIYENVRNLLKIDNGVTWAKIQDIFESLGYSINFNILNASDFGIPQTRRRLFVIGFKNKDLDFDFPLKNDNEMFPVSKLLIDNCDFGNYTFDDNGNIKIYNKPGKVDEKYFLTPLLYKYVMCGGTKSFYQKPIINVSPARTVLKTMGNRHRAGVDNYVSNNGSTKLGEVRMITEREALRLMGFTDDFKIVTSKTQTYKQAGNSIVVDVLIELIKAIKNTKVFD